MTTMEHIKPSDRVLVRKRLNDDIATVERVTKTQIILTNGTRYRRSDGTEVGRDVWSGSFIEDPTYDDFLRITYRNAVTKAERALSTRNMDPAVARTPQGYKDLLLDAKSIIDAALVPMEEA